MAAFYNQVILTWRDHNGKEASAFLSTQDQNVGGAAAYAALADAFDACADAKVAVVQFQTTLIRAAAPVAGVYSTVWDRGVLFDRNPTSKRYQRQSIVGPKASIFRADNITIDLSNPNVVALQGACQAVLGDSAGNVIGPFARGERQKASGS